MEETMTEQLIPDDLPDDVSWGFTRAGLLYVRHHFHWIAVTKGFARSNLAKHWPGLVWNDLMHTLNAAKVWKSDPSHFSGKDLKPQVKEFHILHDGTFRVIRFTDVVPSASVGEVNPDRDFGGGFNIEITPELLGTDEGRRNLARAIIEGLRPRKSPPPT